MRNRFPCSEHSFVLHTQKFCVFLIFQPHELMLSDVVTCKVGAFWLCIYLLWDATAGLIQMEPCVLHPSPVSSAVWSLLYGLLGKAERLLQINQLSQKPSFMHACTSWLFFSSEHRSIALGNLSKTLCWIFLQSLTSVATSPANHLILGNLLGGSLLPLHLCLPAQGVAVGQISIICWRLALNFCSVTHHAKTQNESALSEALLEVAASQATSVAGCWLI